MMEKEGQGAMFREIRGVAWKKVLVIIFVLLVLGCAFGGYGLKLFLASKGKTGPDLNSTTVERGTIEVKVVETGLIDAVKSVEVKSRVAGRLASLFVDEGDTVTAGQLVAIIDPKETEFQVEQNRAQLRGAESSVARTQIELEQRRKTAVSAYRQAEARVLQVKKELDIQPLLTRTSIEQARASLASAQKERERLVQTAHPNQRTNAEATLTEARASLENAQREYNRQAELVRKGYSAEKVLENAQLALDVAKSRMRSAEETSARIAADQRLELERVDQDISRAKADVERSEANRVSDEIKRREYESALAGLETARAGLRDVEALRQGLKQSESGVDQITSVLSDSLRQLGETEIRAPISGVVTQKLIQEGELVASLSSFSSGTPIVRIEVRDQMRVKLSINEIDVARLRLGMPAEVVVDALPETTFRGRVTKIAPSSLATGQQTASAAGEAVVKYSVEVGLIGTDPMLKSGMSAKCTMSVLKKEKVLRLPTEFVGKDAKGSFVMLAPTKADGKAVRKEVKTGASSGAFVEVVSGVKEGDKLKKPPFNGPKRQGAIMTGPPPEEE